MDAVFAVRITPSNHHFLVLLDAALFFSNMKGDQIENVSVVLGKER